MNTVVGLFLFVLATTTAISLPSNFKTCKRSNSKMEECLATAIADAIIKLKSGNRNYKILPLEPLKVNGISIGGTENSVSLRQDYKDIELHGLTKGLVVTKVIIDWNKRIFFIESYNPEVDFVGNYKIDGKILLLPIRGAGHSNISMLDLKTESTVLWDEFKKDGESYMKIKNFKIKFTPKKVLLKFENLFDGDPVLAEPMETFLNENADLLFKELQAPYETSFGLVFAQIANELFSKVPTIKIFPE